ncbi:MAG TPA: efflux RND transporter periplasmic adaptor subunit [Gemmatimonadaceae bacterium]|nr:efflux RND transporter periplasmic adaptor subunit [Gemmatimonadaceae bacterium]
MSAMSWSTRFRALPAKSRRLIVGGLALAVLGAGTLAVAAGRDRGGRAADASAGDVQGMDDMPGMQGMSMSGGGTVRLTADQMRQFGVTFASVEERTLESAVRTVGLVSLDETRVAQVAPRFSGYLERLHVDYTGQPVRRGQPLVAIYSPELVSAQEELLLASRLDATIGESAVPGIPTGSSDLVGAAKRRLELWDISEAQIAEILRTGRVQRTLTLSSPIAGVVIEKNVVQGQAIQSGQTMYTIADLRRVWVEAELREGDLASVREGTAADIEVPAYPGQPFKGRVEFIHPTLDQQARTVRARISVANSERLLKPGMYATVRLNTPTRRALTVPTSALIRTGERTLVFVDYGDDGLAPQEVEVGRTAGQLTEVLAGLEPGQHVVTSAQFILDSEANLAEVMRAMMGQMGASDVRSMEGMGDMDSKGAEMKGTMPSPARR